MAKAATRKMMKVDLTKDRLAFLTANPWYVPDLDAAKSNGKALPKTELLFSNRPNHMMLESYIESQTLLIGSPVNANVFERFSGYAVGGGGNDMFVMLVDSTAVGGGGSDYFRVYFARNARFMEGSILDLQKNDTVEFLFTDDGGETISRDDINGVIAKYKDLCKFKLNFYVSKSFTGTDLDDEIHLTGYDLTVNGGNGNDSIEGAMDGSDVLNGGEGNDTIDGGGLNDTITGGAGADTIYLYKGDKISDSEDIDTIIITETGVNLKDVKGRIIYEMQVLDKKVRVNGGDYADTLNAFGTAVTLTGGSGKDSFLVNDPGDDITDLEKGEIIAIYGDTFGGDVLGMMEKAMKWQSMGAIVQFTFDDEKKVPYLKLLNGNDAYRAYMAAKIHGGGGHDTIEGSGLRDSLYGDSGNDVLIGYGGDDVILGGEGNDELFGLIGNDWIESHAGNDILNGGDGNDVLRGHEGNDTLNGGTGNDIMWGGSGADFLIGGDGNDLMWGGQGDDTIVASSGNDVIIGDYRPEDTAQGPRGKDMFVFNVTNEAYLATITDFKSGEDKINLSGFTMAGLSVAQIRTAVNFSKGMLTADFNGDGLLDLNVKLDATARFNKGTDLIVAQL